MEMPADADPQPIATHGPYVFVPLYGFASDAGVLDFSEGLQICNYDEEKLELLLEHWDLLKQYLLIYPTTYLLQARPPEGDFSMEVTRENEKVRLTIQHQAALKCLEPAYNLVQALRLFKPGSFCRGPDWLCYTLELEGQPKVVGVPLPMTPAEGGEPIALGTGDAVTYNFELAELDPFKGFNTELGAAIEGLAASISTTL